MGNSANVVAGTGKPGGYAFRAPLGTALPTDETTVLPDAFKNQGYASSDGLSRAISKAYEIIRDWNGDEVKRNKTETSVTITFTLIEAANGEVVKTVFGEDAVTITPATASAGTKIAVAYKGEEVPSSTWVFDMKDGKHVRRIVAAVGQNVTEDFTQEMTSGGVISYPVTLVLYPDDAGNFFYEYSDDGVTTA